jgi:type IV pilus assembly protein PilQ
MANLLKQVVCGAVVVCGLSVAKAQVSTRAPATNETAKQPAVIQAPSNPAPTPVTPDANDSSMVLVQAAPGGAPTATPAKTGTAAVEDVGVGENGGVGVREFQGDDVGQVLRLLARQAKINMVVSEAVTGTVTMRLENVTALQAVAIIVKAKSLFMDQIENVYYIKTAAERTAEPTESDSYQFSYSRAKDVATLIASQLASKDVPQIDERTNMIFYRETRSNIDNVRKTLASIDKPTKQVMIEARLVEVNANPKQSYGINWAGVFGSSSSPQTFRYGGSATQTVSTPQLVTNPDGTSSVVVLPPVPPHGIINPNGTLAPQDFLRDVSDNLSALGNQFAILSIPAMSATMRLLNEDADAEFLANPRIVTADNQQAKIEITRNQPVPQLNFNEQTATAVFGGFQDKKFGNTLLVRPSVNKDNFITLNVKPEISNKVADATFVFAGATVASPVIDTRSLESNVLIKSGDTLAVGGLLQDEQTKARTKVPILGDIPIVGYFFQEKLNARTKRNLLVFVTPTIIDGRYGTGLEDQISGLHHSGEEYADPNGWRNNAKGAVRLVPTSQRQLTADYPKPGIPPAPDESRRKVQFMSTAKDRDF